MTARTVPLDGCGGGGGLPAITGVELAGALAGLADHKAWLLLAKYAGDGRAAGKLRAYLGGEVMASTRIFNDDYEPEKLAALTRMLYRDLVAPGRCRKCGGAGVHKSQRVCLSCEGTGRERVPDAARARGLEITLKAWRASYAAIHERVTYRTLSWESDGLRHLRQRLGTDEESP